MNCWRCGQYISRTGATFCDRCGAPLGSYGPAGSGQEVADFDHKVSVLFYIVGASAIVLAIAGGILASLWSTEFYELGLLGLIGAIAGVMVGAFFLWLAYGIDHKMD